MLKYFTAIVGLECWWIGVIDGERRTSSFSWWLMVGFAMNEANMVLLFAFATFSSHLRKLNQ